MFKNIPAVATGGLQNINSRLISDPDALDFSDTPSALCAAGITGDNEFIPSVATGSLQSIEFDGIDDYIKLQTLSGLGSEILLDNIGDEKMGEKHGSTANNIAFESWIKIHSSITGIDQPSQYY